MKIDLRKLIQDRGLERAALSRVLFPKAKHPNMALARLLSGRSKLTEEQIYRLAIHTGLSIDALYAESMYWKKSAQHGLVRFHRDEYSAIYAPQTGITKVYHLDSLLATHILSKPNQPIEEYLQEINSIIINKQVKS